MGKDALGSRSKMTRKKFGAVTLDGTCWLARRSIGWLMSLDVLVASLSFILLISATQPITVGASHSLFERNNALLSSDPTSCMENQTPFIVSGIPSRDLVVPCLARCNSGYYQLTDSRRIEYNFHWSIVYEIGSIPGGEREQNLVNLYNGNHRFNKNASEDQRNRYSIITDRGTSHGNLLIHHLSQKDSQLFLCQYGPSMQLGRIIKVNISAQQLKGTQSISAQRKFSTLLFGWILFIHYCQLFL